jgi:hypothetical protein
VCGAKVVRVAVVLGSGVWQRRRARDCAGTLTSSLGILSFSSTLHMRWASLESSSSPCHRAYDTGTSIAPHAPNRHRKRTHCPALPPQPNNAGSSSGSITTTSLPLATRRPGRMLLSYRGTDVHPDVAAVHLGNVVRGDGLGHRPAQLGAQLQHGGNLCTSQIGNTRKPQGGGMTRRAARVRTEGGRRHTSRSTCRGRGRGRGAHPAPPSPRPPALARAGRTGTPQ